MKTDLKARGSWAPLKESVFVLSAGLVLITTGCAALATAVPTSSRAVRQLVDDTARVYNVPTIEVMVGPGLPWVAGTYRRGIITVRTDWAYSRSRDCVVAHELAHYLLAHDTPLAGRTASEREREMVQRELEANAKAVEILQRVKRLSEAQALRAVYQYLLSAHRTVARKRGALPWGHLSPCKEIADLLKRFPAQAAWTRTLECARGV